MKNRMNDLGRVAIPRGMKRIIETRFPPGTRIRLQEMNDPYSPVPPGTEGTVEHIDDAGQLHMKWDNGRTLALIHGVDRFTVISE